MATERIGQQLRAMRSNAGQISDIATAKSFLRWFGRGIAWWWRQIRGRNRPNAARPQPLVALGIEVKAVGKMASAVFGDFRPTPRRHDIANIDVILSDASIPNPCTPTPVVALSEHPEIAVPAFDPATFNPIGWRREVKNRVAALGPPRLLPTGVSADSTVHPTRVDKLRSHHHVVDVAAFHRSPEERAGALVRVAATGTPIHLADSSRELETLLGSELLGLMKSDVPEADPGARELLSIALRRCALQGHSLRSRARQLSRAAGKYALPLPDVSIVLATKRPNCLRLALANVAKQDYPQLELIVALHGGGFDEATIGQAVERMDIPVTIIRVAEGEPLGMVLNLAAEAASGHFIAKMDDDDLYDTFHVNDLVLAYEYSGAQLVGKYHEVTYLADIGKTIEVRRGQGEQYTWHVSGAALLISRHDLIRIGGWRRIPSNVDVALVDDVIRSRGAIYRIHGAGLISIRHGHAHTWVTTDKEQLERANNVHDGWHPHLAGIYDVPKPPPIR